MPGPRARAQARHGLSLRASEARQPHRSGTGIPASFSKAMPSRTKLSPLRSRRLAQNQRPRLPPHAGARARGSGGCVENPTTPGGAGALARARAPRYAHLAPLELQRVVAARVRVRTCAAKSRRVVLVPHDPEVAPGDAQRREHPPRCILPGTAATARTVRLHDIVGREKQRAHERVQHAARRAPRRRRPPH